MVSLFPAVGLVGRVVRRSRVYIAGVAGTAILVSLPGELANAQGAVAGQVSILERPGVRTRDLADAVIWLEARGVSAVPPARAQIVMESRTYVPRVRVVPVGSFVAFPNQLRRSRRPESRLQSGCREGIPGNGHL